MQTIAVPLSVTVTAASPPQTLTLRLTVKASREVGWDRTDWYRGGLGFPLLSAGRVETRSRDRGGAGWDGQFLESKS